MAWVGWHLRDRQPRHPLKDRRRSAGPWAGLAAGAALIGLAAVVVSVTVPPAIDAGVVPLERIPALRHRAHGPAAPRRPGRSADAEPVTALPDPETGPPRRLVVPTLHIDARVVPVHRIAGGGLAVPSDPRVLGWWANSAVPGSPVGTVVIDGHVDSAVAGLGALFYLRTLKPGARLTVTGPQGRLTYTVAGLREYPKNQIPEQQLFSQHVAGRLVVITCGGPFDRTSRHYLDNVVAFAVPQTAVATRSGRG